MCKKKACFCVLLLVKLICHLKLCADEVRNDYIFYGTEATSSLMSASAYEYFETRQPQNGTISIVKALLIPPWRDEGPRSKGNHIWMHIDCSEKVNEADLMSIKQRLGYLPEFQVLFTLRYKIAVNKQNPIEKINKKQLLKAFQSESILQWKDMFEHSDEQIETLFENTKITPIIRINTKPISIFLVNALRLTENNLKLMQANRKLDTIDDVISIVQAEVGSISLLPIKDDTSYDAKYINLVEEDGRITNEFNVNFIIFSHKQNFESKFINDFFDYIKSIEGIKLLTYYAGTKVQSCKSTKNNEKVEQQTEGSSSESMGESRP